MSDEPGSSGRMISNDLERGDPPFTLSALKPKHVQVLLYYFGEANLDQTEAYGRVFSRHRENAARFFRRPAIQAAIRAELGSRIDEVREMGGAEVKKRLTVIARFDITDALAANDPIRQWPEGLRLCIKALKPTKHGRVIEWHDPVAAMKLLGQASGVLRETLVVEQSLAEIIVAANALAAAPPADGPGTESTRVDVQEADDDDRKPDA
jgi:hypothetical protein